MTSPAPLLGGPAELVLDARAELAEGPLWDAGRHVLWWVDINAGCVHRFDPATGSDSGIEIGRSVGCLALREDDALVVAAADAVLILDPEAGGTRILATFAPEAVATRCNDGRCDPRGRFWIDRMAIDHAVGGGSLVRLDGSGLDTKLRGLTIPNGLDWSADGSRLYFVDSATRTVFAFDFEMATGAIGDRRPFALVDASLRLPPWSVPDGLAVDAEDCVWVAVWGGGCVLRFAPDGALLGRIDVPVARVSNCAFGGDDLTELFVTTAREVATPDDPPAEPAAGGIYRARPGVRGRPSRRFGERSLT
jgi:sugar lactone lactonase YvrE